ncbi:hypothetical protein M0811_02050 [Anaeramoeba ignava]|uniref:Uncharacterized protein n=1 Tax=Anaeramoeba ignava TaxID=1746090 RepID=A0A9Q0LCP3_ANAIG|nr:hypothetical protein M0811_02050 [Anaeramoeba ignava]
MIPALKQRISSVSQNHYKIQVTKLKIMMQDEVLFKTRFYLSFETFQFYSSDLLFGDPGHYYLLSSLRIHLVEAIKLPQRKKTIRSFSACNLNEVTQLMSSMDLKFTLKIIVPLFWFN